MESDSSCRYPPSSKTSSPDSSSLLVYHEVVRSGKAKGYLCDMIHGPEVTIYNENCRGFDKNDPHPSYNVPKNKTGTEINISNSGSAQKYQPEEHEQRESSHLGDWLCGRFSDSGESSVSRKADDDGVPTIRAEDSDTSGRLHASGSSVAGKQPMQANIIQDINGDVEDSITALRKLSLGFKHQASFSGLGTPTTSVPESRGHMETESHPSGGNVNIDDLPLAGKSKPDQDSCQLEENSHATESGHQPSSTLWNTQMALKIEEKNRTGIFQPHERIKIPQFAGSTQQDKRKPPSKEAPLLPPISAEVWSDWTKISRGIVEPAVFITSIDQFDIRDHHILVHRALSKEEIQGYVTASFEYRRKNNIKEILPEVWKRRADVNPGMHQPQRNTRQAHQPHNISKAVPGRNDSPTASVNRKSLNGDRRRDVIDTIVTFVADWMKSKLSSAQDKTDGSNSLSCPGQTNTTSHDHNSKVHSQHSKKRKKQNGDSSEDDADGSEEEPGKFSPLQKGKGKDELRFACPYFKHNPVKYGKEKHCCGPGWPKVHRMKEHLYRRHRQPNCRCKRCGQSFNNETDLEHHLRAVNSCPLKKIDPIDGFDDSQEKLLRSRKKEVTDLPEHEKWRHVYKILFPDTPDESIPCPFYEYEQASMAGHDESRDSPSLDGYERFLLLQEIPPFIRRNLERNLETDLNIFDESQKQHMIEYVKKLSVQLVHSYRKSTHHAIKSCNNPSSATAGSSSGETGRSPQTLTHDTFGPDDYAYDGGELDFEFFETASQFDDSFFAVDDTVFVEELLRNPSGSGEKGQSDSGYGSISPRQSRQGD